MLLPSAFCLLPPVFRYPPRMLLLVQIVYWLALSTWFGGVLFVALSAPVVFNTVRENNPILPTSSASTSRASTARCWPASIVGNLHRAAQPGRAGVRRRRCCWRWSRSGRSFKPSAARPLVQADPAHRRCSSPRSCCWSITLAGAVAADHGGTGRSTSTTPTSPTSPTPPRTSSTATSARAVTLLTILLALLLGMILFSAGISVARRRRGRSEADVRVRTSQRRRKRRR